MKYLWQGRVALSHVPFFLPCPYKRQHFLLSRQLLQKQKLQTHTHKACCFLLYWMEEKGTFYPGRQASVRPVYPVDDQKPDFCPCKTRMLLVDHKIWLADWELMLASQAQSKWLRIEKLCQSNPLIHSRAWCSFCQAIQLESYIIWDLAERRGTWYGRNGKEGVSAGWVPHLVEHLNQALAS